MGQIRARKTSFGASFYPNCLSEWNKLDSEIRQLPTLGLFKKKLFSLIRPLPQPVYGIHDPKGLAILTRLRVGLSKLNLHKFKHNFKDTVNPMCSINDGIEDTEHSAIHKSSPHPEHKDERQNLCLVRNACFAKEFIKRNISCIKNEVPFPKLAPQVMIP